MRGLIILMILAYVFSDRCTDFHARDGIWGEVDARVRCSSICNQHNLRWEGNWRSIPTGLKNTYDSVCGCCIIDTSNNTLVLY